MDLISLIIVINHHKVGNSKELAAIKRHLRGNLVRKHEIESERVKIQLHKMAMEKPGFKFEVYYALESAARAMLVSDDLEATGRDYMRRQKVSDYTSTSTIHPKSPTR